ncbi:MAG: hypothetical protein IKX40_01810 [Thermoguttaceae bacterium]|nr:hypothetical protein [Thermoguttaceae bacterium]
MRTTFSLLISCVLAAALSVFSLNAQAQDVQPSPVSDSKEAPGPTPDAHPGTILEVKDAPALTVSVRSANAALKAADATLSKINESTLKLYTGVLRMYLSKNGPLGGFDLNRPIGLIIDPQYGAAAVFPVQNWETIQKNLNKEGTLTVLEDNRFKFTQDDGEVFLLLQDNWLAVSTDSDSSILKAIPQSCLDSIEQLSKIYLVGAAVNSSRMTAQDLNDLLQALQSQLEEGLSFEGPLSDVFKKQIQSVTDSISQSLKRYQKDHLTFLLGLNFNPQSGFKLDVALCTDPNTETAKQFSQYKSSTTHLAGFYNPGSAAALSVSSQGRLAIFNNQQETFKALQSEINKQIEKKYTDERKKNEVKRFADALTAIVAKTFSDSNNETAITVYAEPDRGATVIAAVFCKDAQEIENMLFDFIKNEILSGSRTMFSCYNGSKRNAAIVNDVKIHTLTFTLSKEDKNYDLWRKLLNSDDVVIAFGFGKNIVCVAVGADSLNQLKTALEKNGPAQASPIFQYNVQYGTLARFIEAYNLISEEDAKDFAKFKKTMGKQFNSPCQKTSVLFVEQTPSACAIRYQEEIPFDVIKFVTKLMKLGE